MAILWICRLSPKEYALAGRHVEVPRPDCSGCGVPMTFEGSYPRSVRVFPEVWRIQIRRAVCPRCGVGHALLPDFVTAKRLDHVEVIGAALAVAATNITAGLAACGVPAATQRSWCRRFAGRPEELGAGFVALATTYDLWPPDIPTGPPPLRAVAGLGAAWDASRRRCARAGKAIVAPWRFANVIVGGTLMATRANVSWVAFGMAPFPRKAAPRPP